MSSGVWALTQDATECVMRLAEPQQAAVLVEFGDESQITEQQPVCSFLILLLFNLADKKSYKDALFPSDFKLVAKDGVNVFIFTSS